MNSQPICSSLQSVKSIIDLYTKIPDYSALKHLGNSEFIYKIEKLKDEFREIRSSLYKEEDELDSSVAESSFKGNNVGHQSKNRRGGTPAPGRFDRNVIGKSMNKISNVRNVEKPPYFSVSSCELHQNPLGNTRFASKYLGHCDNGMSTSSLSRSHCDLSSCPGRQPRRSYEREDMGKNDDGNETWSSAPSLSHWSSSPEISIFQRKEYFPPQNIENRLMRRKAKSKEEVDFSRSKNADSRLSNLKPGRSQRIPSAVSKPLFNQIVEQNSKRSQKVREQSKQKLMAQVKPFSFSKSAAERFQSQRQQLKSPDTLLPLNNSKLGMNSKNISFKHTKNFKVHKNTLQENPTFRALPAPPRSRALMAALRLKEQQEYRELKKQLRSEALMKLSSLPPGMASRNNAGYKIPKAESTDDKYKLQSTTKWNRKRDENLEDGGSTCTDEDRVSEDSFAENKSSNRRSADKAPFKGSYSSGLSGIAKGPRNVGVFESTSNDNVASRLRVEAAKKKEADRVQQEAEAITKLKKSDEKRYKLRSFHWDVWRHACSYSSSQDIAMRRQLRMATAILENDSFKREMSTMLSRVQSAPLLLQGVRERHCEPCKKHQKEIQISQQHSSKFKMNIPKSPNTPRKYLSRRNWTSGGEEEELLTGGVTGDGQSETLAIAEGSLTNSDNESVKGDQLEEDDNRGDKIRSHDDVTVLDNEAAQIEREADDIIGKGVEDGGNEEEPVLD